MERLKLCMLIFQNMTLQDFSGPYDVFIRTECFDVYIVSENKELIKAEGGISLKADYSFDECPQADILFVPGGIGITPLLTKKAYYNFLQKQGSGAKYITSVCSGSLLLAAHGLLYGYKATTHWRSLQLLRMFGVEVKEQRVVTDRNRITGGGVTSGIDFGLALTALICGENTAKTVQLLLEYNPLPPFSSGSPQTAEPHILKMAIEITQNLFESREKIIRQLIHEEEWSKLEGKQ